MVLKSSLLLALFLLSACTLQQHRHSVPVSETPSERPSGRVLSSSINDWKLYTIKGSKRPLQIRTAEDAIELGSHKSIGVYWQRISIDTSKEPVLGWQWKVSRLYEESSPWVAETDNFPARVLVGFDATWDDADAVALSFKRKVEEATGESPPSRAICYTFGGSLPSHEAIDGSFGSGRVAVINLRGPSTSEGKWLSETRDIQRDYEAVFQLPAPKISMIGIACDTHLVKGEAQAWFKNFTAYPPSERNFLESTEPPESVGGSNWQLLIVLLCSVSGAVIAITWLKFRH
ncbi:DUF3047 domain-containing protein [Planctomycetota bacterium]|nr:DUF3047 domain-containing protein [Planctomycetota bacterium]